MDVSLVDCDQDVLRLEGWGAGGAKVFADEVKVAESNGKRLGWVVEGDFGGEATDCDVSAANSIEEGGVGRRAERARDVSSKGRVFEIRDGRDGGVDG